MSIFWICCQKAIQIFPPLILSLPMSSAEEEQIISDNMIRMSEIQKGPDQAKCQIQLTKLWFNSRTLPILLNISYFYFESGIL